MCALVRLHYRKKKLGQSFNDYRSDCVDRNGLKETSGSVHYGQHKLITRLCLRQGANTVHGHMLEKVPKLPVWDTEGQEKWPG